MNDSPIITHTAVAAAHLATPRGRQLFPPQQQQQQPRGPTSDSPIRQQHRDPYHTDDFLSSLSPRTAVDAFRSPTGALKACMDAATPAEQAFATRVAIASKSIQEWLDELSAWPWPSAGGSAGFEVPGSKRKRLSRSDGELLRSPDLDAEGGEEPQNNIDKMYLGSLLATEVTAYERRIDEIGRDMEELDVEEIKNQVLHNHIMPLSRPCSPMPGTNSVASSSLSAYVRMDDLTALLTATTIRTLPNLSRLTRLLNLWSLRLIVLRRIPIFFESLADGEIALQSGWNAIGLNEKTDISGSPRAAVSAKLSRKEFDVMKKILERKIAHAGRDLDAMLDILEGWEDTLPNEWLDRMDALERRYGEWAVICERQIRDSDWAKFMKETVAISPTKGRNATDDHGVDEHTESNVDPVGPLASSPPTTPHNIVSPIPKAIRGNLFGPKLMPRKRSLSPDSDGLPETQTPILSSSFQEDQTPVIKVHFASEDSDEAVSHDGTVESSWARPEDTRRIERDESVNEIQHASGPLYGRGDDEPEEKNDLAQNYNNQTDDDDENQLQKSVNRYSEAKDIYSQPDLSDFEFDSEDYSMDDVPEPELPTLPRTRRDSEVSNSSTILHGDQSGFMDFSSDQPDHGTPERPRNVPGMGIGGVRSDDLSPPSSPNFRSSTRSQSVSFADMPTVAEISDDDSLPHTPNRSSIISLDDDLPPPREAASSSKPSIISADDQLRQQISDILESVPAKIRLTSEPSSAINLNPPDFTIPHARNNKPQKPSADAAASSSSSLSMQQQQKQQQQQRSHSSLSTRTSSSSRAGTPSFTLAPAYARNARPRQWGGSTTNQEIRLYHLSRSNGEAPIKLHIRCVGEKGERVMVRVGGGWADLGEYLKEYASHHGRRSQGGAAGESKVEVKDLPRVPMSSRAATAMGGGSSPPSRPASAMDGGSSFQSPMRGLNVRKTRRITPLSAASLAEAAIGGPASDPASARSSSRLSWTEEDSSLGMAGPRAKHKEMSEEKLAWVKSIEERVRIASSDRSRLSDGGGMEGGKFGEMGKVGATKRLFRRQG
ncbi:hypothetical protein B0T17DRAFT_510492 [Bombardia bombarda]|uniref:GAR domain-containing protein n=1 Tax=Bombardia bombarda TaxID=252184 RepID=A0AA39WID4_9PEZI|nr:hypothetical protein B0T17DRAFT_510492 [Bombardia bombarda]